jgi:hypothetical protein
VPEGTRDNFVRQYGPEGSWAHLFAQAEGYLGTELLQDAADPERFLTIDHWSSQADFEAFKIRFSGDYDTLDVLCESLTESENHIGQFYLP